MNAAAEINDVQEYMQNVGQAARAAARVVAASSTMATRLRKGGIRHDMAYKGMNRISPNIPITLLHHPLHLAPPQWRSSFPSSVPPLLLETSSAHPLLGYDRFQNNQAVTISAIKDSRRGGKGSSM